MENQTTVALAGNPNSGKTTVFKALTGGRQHVGNYPGVTVERKEGLRRYGGIEMRIVDLPGTYSLTAYSAEELVALNFLVDEKPDVVVDIVDASNLERNLYLTVQLLELGVFLVLAFNMSDMARSRGYEFDLERLSHFFGDRIVPTVENKGEGLEALLEAIAGRRNGFISEACQGAARSTIEVRHTISDRIDAMVTSRVLGLPLFLGLMYQVFHLTFPLGDPLMGWIEGFFGLLGEAVKGWWPEGSESLLLSLLADGIIGGVGGVPVFLLTILRGTILKGEAVPFVMELPPCRLPTLKGILIHMGERGWLYLRKAGTVILDISILLWAMSTFPGLPEGRAAALEKNRQEIRSQNLTAEEKAERLAALDHEAAEAGLRQSLAGRIGCALEPLLQPIGFDWPIGTALLGAFAAKKVFVAQLGIVYALGEADEESETLREKLKKNFTPLVGFCIMLFGLISAPCMATIAITRRESNPWRRADLPSWPTL